MVSPLVVAAASSLATVLPKIARLHRIDATFDFGASTTQARQIAQGIRVDVFACADVRDLEPLERTGAVERGALRFATNRLVVVAPRRPGARIASLFAPQVRRIALPRPQSTPSGRAARAGLIATGRWDALRGRIVVGATARQTLEMAVRGDVDAAIVFRTDALAAADRLDVVGDAPGTAPLVCAAGVVVGTGQPERARRFVAALAERRSRRLLADAGFGPP